MNLPELNALARELSENDEVYSAVTRGYGKGTMQTATSVALEVVANYATYALTDAINHRGAKVGTMRTDNDGNLHAIVFAKK